MNLLKKLNLQTILIIILIIFFFIYCWFAFSVTLQNYSAPESKVIFSWPDAMANYNFVENFHNFSNFQINEPLNLQFHNIIHPRSTNINSLTGAIVPTAFLGFVFLLGLFSKIVGVYLVNFITPLIAIIGVFYFYKLIKQIFDNDLVGFFSALLLLTLCSFWYYANLTMLSTVIFTSLLIIGFYYLINFKTSIYHSLTAGFILSLALTIRLNEIAWITIVVIGLAIIFRKKIRLKNSLLFLLGGLIPLSILLILNHYTYGSALSFGYLSSDPGQSIGNRLPAEITSSQNSIINYLKLLFLPFGFYEKTLITNILNYFILFIWPYLTISLLSLIILFANFKQTKKSIKMFFYFSLLVSFLLVLYYGSWKFVDTLVLENNTIGSSYIRYWLIIDILTLPFIAYLFEKFWRLPIAKYFKFGTLFIVIMFLTSYSFIVVYKTPGDGLVDQKSTIQEYHQRAYKINQIIPEESIVLTDRTDKILFPQNKVIDFNLNYKIFSSLENRIPEHQIYYLTLLTDTDINYINNKKIAQYNLKFSNPIIVDDNYRIFELEKSH